jgi:hypothetical protein
VPILSEAKNPGEMLQNRDRRLGARTLSAALLLR